MKRSATQVVVLASVLVYALTACEHGARGAPPVVKSARAPDAARSASARPVAAAAPGEPLVELVRGERWLEARARLEQLPSGERSTPSMRFLHARLAQELGDAAVAVADLKDLEAALPSLASQIEALRARAALEAGPFVATAEYYERSANADGLLSAARAWQRAGELSKARVAVERALILLGKSKRVRDGEIRARSLRAELASAQKDALTARGDYHWLALKAPARSEAEQAVAALAELPPQSGLSGAERAERAASFAELGQSDALERELAAGAAVAAGRATFLRAYALYMARRDYAKAAELFVGASRAAVDDPARALFLSARALSRAQLDAQAIARYQEVATRFPKSGYVEQAYYLVARLRFIAGEYKQALAAYDTYLGRFGKQARSQRDASYERALCLLAGGQPERAGAAFAALAKASSDRRERTRCEYLSALAESGLDPSKSGRRWLEIAEREPLSFWALAARARLAAQGAALPALVPAPSGKKPPVALEPKLPAAAQLLHELGLERDAELALRKSEPVLESQYAPSSKQALCELYGQLGVASRRYRLAQDAVRREALDVAPDEGNGWAWRCVYPTPYVGLVQRAARDAGLGPALLFGVMRQESAFDASAVSPVGALGLMQLMPLTLDRTAALLQETAPSGGWRSPALNLRLGAAYLARLQAWFAGHRVLLTAAYNAGPDVVYRWLDAKSALSADLFVAHIPFSETREYVERVLGNEARYAYLDGGEAGVTPLVLELPKGIQRAPDAF